MGIDAGGRTFVSCRICGRFSCFRAGQTSFPSDREFQRGNFEARVDKQ